MLGGINIIGGVQAFLEMVAGWGGDVWNWLVSDITIGSWTFKPLYIGGALFVTLILSWLIGKIIGWVG